MKRTDFEMTKGIVFDLETTGLDSQVDEILSISIIDTDGNILLDTYVKPVHTTSWVEAYKVNGITKEMVEDAPTLDELASQIRNIFESAEMIIGYNELSFDLNFLDKLKLNIKDKKIVDIMLDFAEVYGEWNEKYNDYKWKKLIECADYYGYHFKAHNSLEDVKATLFCYKKMLKQNAINLRSI